MSKIYIVCRYDLAELAVGDGADVQFQGVFDSKEKAVGACRDAGYFVGTFNLNESLPHEKTYRDEIWEYPLPEVGYE